MAIAQSFIDTLKTSCDIETVISGYLPLNAREEIWWGLCPSIRRKRRLWWFIPIPSLFIVSVAEPGETSSLL